jgi:antibiotic biosynthesis monooxygenase (ABM) superfamily enzyme
MERTESSSNVTIVTQTRVRPERYDTFAAWQAKTNAIVATFPGFVDRTVMPPSPPAQVDWVIQQRFVSAQAAVAWLNSKERQEQLREAAPMLVGRDDVHLVTDEGAGVLPSPVSAVMSTYIKPGQEAAHRAWERRIATIQSQAPGFQGYRFEPPISGVQNHWLSIVRFDSEANLQAWLASPERQKLVAEAGLFTADFQVRIARTGFDQWFPATPDGAPRTAIWKQNMLVLLSLYPVVFLFSTFVQTPFLADSAHMPFAIALFIGNVVSILLLNYLVPWISVRFSWWLAPTGPHVQRVHVTGAALVAAIYGLMLLAFWWLPDGTIILSKARSMF